MQEKKDKVSYQGGVVVGNVEDKANLKNPVSKMLVKRFDETVFKFLQKVDPQSIHEVGCGEGRLTKAFAQQYDVPIRASDFSKELVERQQVAATLNNVAFIEKSIYELIPEEDGADVIVCCEVLEHLENPAEALDVLKKLQANHYLFSVPREPVWCILNMARGKYLRNLGNTPGHLNHWSKGSFMRLLLSAGFHLMAIECPLPWIIVLGKFNG